MEFAVDQKAFLSLVWKLETYTLCREGGSAMWLFCTGEYTEAVPPLPLPHPQVSNLAGSEWVLRICIANSQAVLMLLVPGPGGTTDLRQRT